MEEFVQQLAQKIRPDLGVVPIVLALEGPLGAGKTMLTKTLAKNLGISEEVTSPTYVLNTEYVIAQAGVFLQHLDVYRLETADEFERLQIERMIDHRDLVIIEWADKFRSPILEFKTRGVKLYWVTIKYGAHDSERIFRLE